MPFTIKFIGSAQLTAAIKALPATLQQKARNVFLNAANKLQATMVRRSTVAGGVFKTNPTGALARSWQVESNSNPLLPISVAIKSQGTPYAVIQEKGGTVTPKKAQWLTIPLDANKTKGGDTRMSATRAFKSGAFVFTSKAGNKIIGQRDGKNIVPLFVLKKSVTIPPRLGFEEQAAITATEIKTGLDKILEKPA